MPIHDWTRAKAGAFHDFHFGWISRLRDALNTGLLPADYYALAEQRVGGPIPDVITVNVPSIDSSGASETGGMALAECPPRTRFRLESDSITYARRSNRIVVRDEVGVVVSVIEIVSPGNKSSKSSLRSFVTKAAEFLALGVHVLIIDLFPPTPRDPQGIHKAIWDELDEVPFELPADKPLTLVSYLADDVKTAFIEPVAVGDALPEMPIFLTPEVYVPAPLESTYMESWAVYPRPLKALVVG